MSSILRLLQSTRLGPSFRYRASFGQVNITRNVSSAFSTVNREETSSAILTSSGRRERNLLSIPQQLGQLRQFQNFGHKKPPPSSNFEVFYMMVIFGSMLFSVLNWGWFLELWREYFPKTEAAVLATEERGPLQDQVVVESGDGEEDTAEGEKKGKNAKIGFRERKIIEYENRIRQFSTPDKVFRYFATLQVVHPNSESEVFMTPDDFLRSITPGMKQPEGLGLDQFKRFDSKHFSDNLAEELGLEKDSIFFKLGSSGLISFSDYVFLLTVLSTSRRHFEIAFRMFDLNGDGNVDSDEFDQVAALLRQTTSVGTRHRDHSTTGSTFKGVNSALSTYFFGPNLDQKLTIEKFLEFQKQLQTEILTLEFKRKELRPDGRISENDFADLLIAYAGYPGKKRSKMLKRVRKAFKEESKGVTLEEYLHFFHFLNNINDVDTALTFYNIASASIDPNTLKHVAKTVAHVDLSEHVVSIVFTIFDENLDGQLSHREFVAVMKNRLMRGLEKPKDTGFIKLLHAAAKCAKETRPAILEF